MNGVHDMGGMHGLGPLLEEKDEPVFHAPWEGRAFALTRAMGGWRLWNLDASRHQRELMAPLDYFRLSYYERWIAALVELMLASDLVSRTEVQSGRPDAGAVVRTPALAANDVPALIAGGAPATRDQPVAARFKVGQAVRARTMNPTGHTRLPRYARGRHGIVHRDHGVFVFPDSNARFAGENPQHVYSVRFGARELWGDQRPQQDSVYLDLWDEYLEPA